MIADSHIKSIQDEQKPKMWSGSGFALNNGYVVTNYHIVEEALNISIRGVNGDFSTSFPATVVASDKANDLSILKIVTPSLQILGQIPIQYLNHSQRSAKIYICLRSPLTSTIEDEIKLTTGVISSKTGFQGDVALYQISAPIQPGNSGGPLFNSKGDFETAELSATISGIEMFK